MNLTRRHIMTGALTLAAMQLFPGLTRAQAKRLVFATFTGSWEEAHRDVLVPAFRKATGNAEMVLDPMLSVDQIAKVTAARANPPIDVMLHDPGPALVAVGSDLTEPYPVDKSAYYKDLIAEAQDPNGPAGFFQVVGLTYNPDKIKTPPTSWADLWKSEYKGKVGITNLNSTLGTGFLVEIARMNGGSEILMARPSAVRISCTIVVPSGRPISTTPATPLPSPDSRRCSGRTHTVTRSPTAAGPAGARARISPPRSSETVASPLRATRRPGSTLAVPTKVFTNNEHGAS